MGTILGIVSSIITIMLLFFNREQLIKWLNGVFIRSPKDKITPLPDQDFHCFTIGNLQIPVTPVIGFDGIPFKIDDVEVNFKNEKFEESAGYPSDLKNNYDHFLNKALDKIEHNNIINNTLFRLDSFIQKPETQNDERGKILINFSLTNYNNMLATNLVLEETIPLSLKHNRIPQTVREKYGFKPYTDLKKSVLSNPPGVESIIISKNILQHPDTQVVVRVRSNDVTLYTNQYQVSSSGYMSLAHVDELGMPSLFVTACGEIKQELAHRLNFVPADFKFLGCALHWHCLYPNFIGYFETDILAEILLGDVARDKSESVKFEAIPFTPESILNHIAENHWTPMSAFAMIMTLLIILTPTPFFKLPKV